MRNVAQASTGTAEVIANIAGVASASDPSRRSEQFKAEVSRFLERVRAA